MNTNFDQLFAPKVEAPTEQKEIKEWRPSFKNAPNKIYQAVVRFVPWYKDPANSIIEKFSVYLENPYQAGSGRTIDSPSSVGEKDPLSDTYWALKNSDNAINVANSRKFSRTQKYSMLIQIIKDNQNPKLAGKILVWRIGKKVYDKIANEMHPSVEGVAPKNPFDIINGRAFLVKCTESGGYNNYDSCQFVDLDKKVSSLKITEKLEDGSYKILEGVDENSDKQKVYDFLVANSPNLDDYKYQPWDEDTTKYVNSVIAFYTGHPSSSGPAANAIASPQRVASLEDVLSTKGEPPKGLSIDTIMNSGPADVSGVDLSDLGTDAVPASVAQTPPNLDDILGNY